MLEVIRPVRIGALAAEAGGDPDRPRRRDLAVVAFNALDCTGHGERALSLQGDFFVTMLAACRRRRRRARGCRCRRPTGSPSDRISPRRCWLSAPCSRPATSRSEEAGRAATIAMLIVLANQRKVDIARIIESGDERRDPLEILFVPLAVAGAGRRRRRPRGGGDVVVLLAVGPVRPLSSARRRCAPARDGANACLRPGARRARSSPPRPRGDRLGAGRRGRARRRQDRAGTVLAIAGTATRHATRRRRPDPARGRGTASRRRADHRGSAVGARARAGPVAAGVVVRVWSPRGRPRRTRSARRD